MNFARRWTLNAEPARRSASRRRWRRFRWTILREARFLTQTQLAEILHVSQGAVSKVGRRADMYISTLRSYVRAMGGDVQIRAVFPEGEVIIDQFQDLDQR